eukprot:4061772-Pyramimonas_sp.AAC.1
MRSPCRSRYDAPPAGTRTPRDTRRGCRVGLDRSSRRTRSGLDLGILNKYHDEEFDVFLQGVHRENGKENA